MLISIIRHGQAEGGSSTGRDRDRVLTEKGHRQARAAGSYLARCCTPPTIVIGSPYARAHATAKEIAGVLGLDVQIDDRLGCEYGLSELLAVVSEYQEHDAIAIVGHMPTVGAAVSMLTQGPGGRDGALSTGEVVLLRVDGQELIGGAELADRFRMRD
jgi:phosphohistidine phosphatase